MNSNQSVGAWIMRWATRTPERLALIHARERLTYAQLSERVCRVASALASVGVDHGDRVAWVATHELAALELVLACGLLGAVGAPLSPHFTGPELTAISERLRPRVLVLPSTHTRTLRGVLPRQRFVTGECVDGFGAYEAFVASGNPRFVPRAVSLQDDCLVAFSSGTSGSPKGALLTHENLLFNALNVISALDYRQSDVILASAPLHRMGGLGFLLPLWLRGGTCVLPASTSPEHLLLAVATHGVSVLFDAVPSLSAMTASPAFVDADLSSLRVCATGGTPVPVSLVHAFRARGITLQPGYGLTEASPVVTVALREDVARSSGSVGKPVPFCEVRVVDDQQCDVPDGEVGELLVRGPSVMRGYFGAADATARTLIAGRWLRTGDAGRRAPDGTLFVLGRLSDSLWLDGMVVHPGPLESAVCQLPAIAECALVQRVRDARPELWVVVRERADFDEARLLACCRAHLGVRWVPRVRRLAALPRNAHGKVLRRALRTRSASMAS